MDRDTSKLDLFAMEEQFCVNGGQERGLAGGMFIKPSLPNAANSIEHGGRDKGGKTKLNNSGGNIT